MNGRHRFVFLWRCGCVFSERALQELKSADCHECGAGYVAEDVIVINGTQPEDALKMEANMTARRERAKLEKKNKKKRKADEGEAVASLKSNDDGVPEPKKTTAAVVEDGIAAALKEFRKSTSEGPDPPKEKSKLKPKVTKGDPSGGADKEVKDSKSAKSTVQNDPSKSEVYKSLFTSHKDAVNQPKAHWVTMNPGYYR